MKNQTVIGLEFGIISNQEKIEASDFDNTNESDIKKLADPESLKKPTQSFFSSPCLLSEFEDD